MTVIQLLDKLPKWFLIGVLLLVIVVLGYLDYLVSDYSMLIFYAVPVAVGGWFAEDWGAALTALASGLARGISDYFTYSNKTLGYSNSAEDTLFLLIAGLLLSNVRRILEEEKRESR